MKRGASGWRWVRAHWVDLMLPAFAFLLGAGIYRQVQWLRDGRRTQEARRHYQAAVRAEGKGDRRAALDEARAAARVTPDDPGMEMRIATLLESLAEPVPAARLLERALRAEKSPTQAQYLQLAQTWSAASRDEDAERVLREQVLRRWPDSAEAALLEGLIRMRRDPGEPGLRQAAACFERALRGNPRHAGALYQYGVCLSRLGRAAEAERAFRQALRQVPSRPETLYALAGVLRKEGKQAEARHTLAEFERIAAAQRQARELEVRRSRKQIAPGDLLKLATLDLALDRPRHAEAALGEYLLREPADPRGHRQLAEVYRRTRQAEKARAATQLASALEARTPYSK